MNPLAINVGYIDFRPRQSRRQQRRHDTQNEINKIRDSRLLTSLIYLLKNGISQSKQNINNTENEQRERKKLTMECAEHNFSIKKIKKKSSEILESIKLLLSFSCILSRFFLLSSTAHS